MAKVTLDIPPEAVRFVEVTLAEVPVEVMPVPWTTAHTELAAHLVTLAIAATVAPVVTGRHPYCVGAPDGDREGEGEDADRVIHPAHQTKPKL